MAQSFSKNFGLYGERIGALHIVALNEESAGKVEAVLKKISRAEITSTPSFGAKIVASIFHTPELKEQWCRDLKTMSSRLGDMRKQLYDGLMQRNTPGNWGHLLTDVSTECSCYETLSFDTIPGRHVFYDGVVSKAGCCLEGEVSYLPSPHRSTFIHWM